MTAAGSTPTGTDQCRICAAPVYSEGLPVCCRHVSGRARHHLPPVGFVGEAWVPATGAHGRRVRCAAPLASRRTRGRPPDGPPRRGGPAARTRRRVRPQLVARRRPGARCAADMRRDTPWTTRRTAVPGSATGSGPLPAAEPAGMSSAPIAEGMPAPAPLDGAVRALAGPEALAAWERADAARRAAQYGDGARRRRASAQPGYRAGGNRRLPPGGGAG